jgi:hypothetical protein
METLAPLRPAPSVDLATITTNEPGLRPTRPAGKIGEWIEKRHFGEAELCGNFVDLGAAASIAHLRHRLADLFAKFAITEFDLSVLTSLQRKVTMEISRFIHELENREQRRFDGIYYPSRLGHDIGCWAIFTDSKACFKNQRSIPINVADPELQRALRDCRISIDRAEAAS